MWTVLRVRNFRLLWLGEAISMLGDQVYLVALPWLVLQLSNDPLAMGTVLALAGIPRAIFMLVGGVLTDRYSPRTIMLISNLLRMVLVGAMAVLIFAGGIGLGIIYGFALIFGLIDAFFWPAAVSIVPQLLPTKQLQAGNSITQGTAQLTLLVGPLLAGGTIAALGGEATVVDGVRVSNLTGVGYAIAFDAVTFFLSAFTLWLIRMPTERARPHAPSPAIDAAKPKSVLRDMRAGLGIAWRDVSLRLVVFISGAINFLVNGPMIIGIPVLADTRFAQGASAFGIIMAAYGGGSLVGTLLAGVLPRPQPHRFGPLLTLIISLLGFGLLALAFSTLTWQAALIAATMGAANGYVNILFITWLQTYMPQQFMGRIMSLLMFANVGLNPISMIVAGALTAWNTTAFLAGAGVLLAAFTLYVSTLPAMQDLGSRTWSTP